MKITIENTTKIVEVNGGLGGDGGIVWVPARIWEGETESGIPVHCYITRIAVAREENNQEFERELKEQRAPSAAVEGIPMRLIL